MRLSNERTVARCSEGMTPLMYACRSGASMAKISAQATSSSSASANSPVRPMSASRTTVDGPGQRSASVRRGTAAARGSRSGRRRSGRRRRPPPPARRRHTRSGRRTAGGGTAGSRRRRRSRRPTVNGAESISQRTGGLRRPPSIEPLRTARTSDPTLAPRLGVNPMSCMNHAGDHERHAEQRGADQVRHAEVGGLGDERRRAPIP